MSSSDNPYRPPSATVVDVPGPAADLAFAAPGAVVDAGRGVSWIGEGWNLFKAAPALWIVAMVIVLAINMLLGSLVGERLNSLVSVLTGPFISAGMLAFAHGIARGEPADLGKLFIGLREKTGALLGVAGIYLLMVTGLLLVFGIAAVTMVGGFAYFASAGPAGVLSAMSGGGLMGLLLLLPLFVGLLFLVVAAYWFAPGLVLYANLDAWAAMKESFRACLRNWLPFLVYSIMGFLVLMGGMLLLVIGMFLVSLPVLMASYYSSFRDIFGQKN